MKAKEQIVKSDRIKTRNKSEKDQSAKNEEDDDDDEEEDEDEEEEEEEDEDTKDSSKQLRVLDIVNGRKVKNYSKFTILIHEIVYVILIVHPVISTIQTKA